LVVDADAQKVVAKITLEPKGEFTASEAAKLIADALRDQAAIIISPLDGNRVSVTYGSKTKTEPELGDTNYAWVVGVGLLVLAGILVLLIRRFRTHGHNTA
jgi:LPXTG-motif cell wall-anchored protein